MDYLLLRRHSRSSQSVVYARKQLYYVMLYEATWFGTAKRVRNASAVWDYKALHQAEM